MFCSKCGSQNADGAGFCLNCGAPLTASVPSQPVYQVSQQPVYQVP